jgi:ring-1,2-phenylacetyl-CoA epoxidase subunit PaaD
VAGPGPPGRRVVTAFVDIADLIAEVKDPELPFLSIIDLGIVRAVEVEGRDVAVSITPTYSGCPAMDAIRTDLEEVLASWGFVPEIRTVLSPAWTTDDITPEGRRLLAAAGIAPPGPIAEARCPRCSGGAVTVNEFGSTACKALMVCGTCREPFDLFKELR